MTRQTAVLVGCGGISNTLISAGKIFVIGHFLDCVEKGETPETHCEDNIQSLKMVYGAIDSIEKKTKVRIR